MTETQDTERKEVESEVAILERRIDSLERIAQSFHVLMRRENDSLGALFLLENLPGEYNKSPLYAGLVLDLARELDKPEGTEEDSRTRLLYERLLNYLNSQCVSYFEEQRR